MVLTTRSNKSIVTSYDLMFETAYANNQEIVEKDKMTLNGVVHSVSALLSSGCSLNCYSFEVFKKY